VTAPGAGARLIVLGSAAGGGFPQWNCGCLQCRLVRAGDPRVRPATQLGFAVSADGASWLLVGASPDLWQQLLQTPALWPRGERRDTPVTGVALTGGDVDAIAGLLVLREHQPFTLFAPPTLLDLLASNDIFNVLDGALVQRVETRPLQPVPCGPGLTLTLLPMPGKVPLYRETLGATEPEAGPSYAARIRANGRTVVIAPACAVINDVVLDLMQDADLLFFDGTLFIDDEMIVAGLGSKTGTRMGHVPLSGATGALARLAGLRARRILVHINNTNPILIQGSPERRQVEQAGFEIAFDGMEVAL